MIRSLLVAALLAAGPAQAQTPPAHISNVEWMAGTWVQETPRANITETWIGPTNGMMAGVNLTGLPGNRRSFEFLRIVEWKETLTYVASPDAKAPVEFPMKEAGNKRVVFENTKHDFPQRIIYWMDGNQLAARIEGDVQGKLRSQEWRFTRK